MRGLSARFGTVARVLFANFDLRALPAACLLRLLIRPTLGYTKQACAYHPNVYRGLATWPDQEQPRVA